MKILSFNTCSLRTWKDGNWEFWKRCFTDIVAENSPDVIFLQEVTVGDRDFHTDYLKQLEASLGSGWTDFRTKAVNLNSNLNNAVLFRGSAHDISENYTKFQLKNKNLQIVDITNGSRNGKKIIGVNVHFCSDSNSSIKAGSDHEYDLKQLIALLNKLEIDYPGANIFAAGDFNYDAELLRIGAEKFGLLSGDGYSGWTIDDERMKKNVDFYPTTVKADGIIGNSMDHFIFNQRTVSALVQQPCNGNYSSIWNLRLGVLHLNNALPGTPFDVRLKQSTISSAEYHKRISDHFPIFAEII